VNFLYANEVFFMPKALSNNKTYDVTTKFPFMNEKCFIIYTLSSFWIIMGGFVEQA
jgi:hypothetical protein